MAYLSNNQPVFTSLSPGNIIPHEWYKKFTNARSTPDVHLISILSEIVYWYRPKRIKDISTNKISYVNKFLGDAWQTSYEHFEKKFLFNREKIRKIFVKLEQMGIINREFRTVTLRGQKYSNRLFIHLSSEFLNSDTNNKNTPDHICPAQDNKANFFVLKKEEGYPQIEGEHNIDNKNNKIFIKDRSTENICSKEILESKSNFCKIERIDYENKASQTKTLIEFYPLAANDCSILQTKSGRKFTLNAMNEILLNISKRLNNREFKTKEAFMNYMSKIFTHEIRDAVKISNINFKIKYNYSDKEKNLIEQEKYLTNIENSLQVSKEWHLRKKLACIFDTEKSYELLKAYESISREGEIFRIHLNKRVKLTDLDKELILQQVKACYEQLDFDKEQLGYIKKLEIIILKHKYLENILNSMPRPQVEILHTGIWGKIRQSLVSFYGEATDRNWFCKLETNIDEYAKEIKLIAPSAFVKDWIESNYLEIIKKLTVEYNYKISLC